MILERNVLSRSKYLQLIPDAMELFGEELSYDKFSKSFEYTIGDATIKHLVSTISYKLNMVNGYWHWNIYFNQIPDVFLLSGWSTDQKELLHLWVIPSDEIVNGRPFWNRGSFTISEVTKNLKKYEIYEVDLI